LLEEFLEAAPILFADAARLVGAGKKALGELLADFLGAVGTEDNVGEEDLDIRLGRRRRSRDLVVNLGSGSHLLLSDDN
jgi:hypothetical protein